MSKTPPPIQLYANQMEEIKHRIDVIDFLLKDQWSKLHQQTTFESVCLQFRKILELIAFSTLVANKDKYAAAHKHFARSWKAPKILEELSTINPKYYPVPVDHKASTTAGIGTELIPLTKGYLTETEFSDIYERCGGMMHVSNPYRPKISHQYYEKAFSQWREKIILLLDSHLIQLVDESRIWLFIMRGHGDNKVNFIEYSKIGTIDK